MSMNDPQPSQPYSSPVPADVGSKKVLAGVLGILLGSLGIHKFVLGNTQAGIIMLACSIGGILLSFLIFPIFLTWAMGIIGLVEGIMYLTKNDSDFYRTYMVGKKPWF